MPPDSLLPSGTATPRSRWRAASTQTAHFVGRAALSLSGLVAAVAVWELVAVTGIFGAKEVPTPGTVWDSLISLFQSGRGWPAWESSTRRVILGVVIGMFLATPVGFALGWYSRLRGGLEPLVNFCRAVPPIALIPLVIVYLGIGEIARVSVLVWATFFVCVIILYEGIRSINPIFIRAAEVLGANRREIFFKVVLPLSVPHILTATRVALGVSWGTLVAAELVAAQTGLGATISQAADFFDIPLIYAGILLIGATALVMDQFVRLITKRLLRWQDVIAR